MDMTYCKGSMKADEYSGFIYVGGLSESVLTFVVNHCTLKFYLFSTDFVIQLTEKCHILRKRHGLT